MNSKLPIIFLAFLLAVAFVLTSAKKQKKKKIVKTKKSRVIQTPAVQTSQIAKPAETVSEVQPTETTTPASESPVVSSETPPPVVEAQPVIAQPNETKPSTFEEASKTTDVVAKPIPVATSTGKEVKVTNETISQGKFKIKISPVDEWPEMTPDDRIEDLREASVVLRPLFAKDITKDQYQQLVKDSEEYLKNPSAFEQTNFSKTGKVKDFIETLKKKRNEVASKGEVEVIAPIEN